MQFLGGKEKSGGAQIAALINSVILTRSLPTYTEPFVGGLSVIRRITCASRRARYSCEPLITLYNALQQGWEPPTELSKDDWQKYKDNPDPLDPMTAFAGFGCSMFGSWFQGYVKRYKYTNRHVSGAEAAANSLKNKMKSCGDVRFVHADYRKLRPGHIMYCDPPYKGTMGYGAVAEWDSDAFWEWCREWSKFGLVATSEQQAPSDFKPILSFSVQHRIATKSGRRREEHLWVHESQVDEWKP